MSKLGIIALVAVLLFLVPAVALAQPPVSRWYGTVKVGGANVPDGTLVTAWIDLREVGRSATTTYAGSSFYTMDVTGDPATLAGKPVFFLVGPVAAAQQAAQTGVWTAGTNVSLNLTYVATAATPVPPTPTAAPATPTPAAPAATATPKPTTPSTGDDSLSTLIPVVMAGGVLLFIIGAAVLRKGATRKV